MQASLVVQDKQIARLHEKLLTLGAAFDRALYLVKGRTQRLLQVTADRLPNQQPQPAQLKVVEYEIFKSLDFEARPGLPGYFCILQKRQRFGSTIAAP